jgi:hypothetical protein
MPTLAPGSIAFFATEIRVVVFDWTASRLTIVVTGFTYTTDGWTGANSNQWPVQQTQQQANQSPPGPPFPNVYGVTGNGCSTVPTSLWTIDSIDPRAFVIENRARDEM